MAVIVTTLILIALQYFNKLNQPYNAETLLGLMIGISLLHTLANYPRNKLDDLAGDVSYGVFLNHFLILWTIYPQGIEVAEYPGFLSISLGLAWLTHRYIEQPLLKWRHNLRLVSATQHCIDVDGR